MHHAWLTISSRPKKSATPNNAIFFLEKKYQAGFFFSQHRIEHAEQGLLQTKT